ncbi:MAG TPA: hypothetical protein VJ836_04235 [Candidatus Saccharimonadales bacterium]|nr:hypothetical protein [Candidatus Saccharimonadales bacterium]
MIISEQAIEKATHKTWKEWLRFLESIDASKLTHKEIAERLYQDGGAPGWWAQMITVAYEQHIGRRVPGQDCDGEFSVSVSKALDGTMDQALGKWLSLIEGRKAFSDIPVSRAGEVITTDKWRYWRAGLADGSRVNVNIYEKAPDKAGLSVQHEKLESSDQVDHWRSFWKKLLQHI